MTLQEGTKNELGGSYGSINDTTESDDRDYRIGESYYLRKSNKQRYISFLRALGPIVLFTVLMLSLVVVIVYTQDGEIHRWYGRTGRLSHGIETFHKWDSPSGGGISEKSGSFCVTHPKCKSLNLTGSCCPTLEGDLLGCCVRNNSNTHPHQSNATCSKHPRCWSLGLTTDCCPTANGNILECCDLPNDAI